MSESEVLDTKPDCSEEPESAASPNQCESKEEEDGISSSGECDSPGKF